MVWHVDQDHSNNNGHPVSQNGHKKLDAQQEREVLLPVEEQAATSGTGKIDYPRLLELGRELLIALGEDPEREGLQGTPQRWANWWREFIEYDPGKTDTTFNSVSTDQVVCVSGMRVFSLCEHHLLPMWCDVAIGYVPDGKVLGLSKFARIAHQYAHRLQVQERLGHQIADEVSRVTGSKHVAVLIKGEHLCMTSRGIRTPAVMTSSVMRGCFRTDANLRAEFMQMIQS
jgi:GTP cyclohydrolase I